MEKASGECNLKELKVKINRSGSFTAEEKAMLTALIVVYQTFKLFCNED